MFLSVAQQHKLRFGRLIFRFLDHRILDTHRVGVLYKGGHAVAKVATYTIPKRERERGGFMHLVRFEPSISKIMELQPPLYTARPPRSATFVVAVLQFTSFLHSFIQQSV